MNRTGIVLDKRYCNHHPPPGHPESPDRLSALFPLFDGPRFDGIERIEPRSATRDELTAVHTTAYIDRVAESAGRTHYGFDLDTYASSDSYETALLAAGGVLALLEAIDGGRVTNGFALVRPPGHHAEQDRAMGFCLFNNIAIGARYLQRQCGIERILIVDWDVHHGNGTQHSFYADSSVLFTSMHQSPHYPGTGSIGETGSGGAAGYTVNIPLPAGTGDDGYIAAFTRVIDPVARQFDPQFILVSTGFDCHERDPLGGMQLSESGFRAMARVLMRIADDHAGGRVAAVLEGGYDSNALAGSIAAVLDEMQGKRSGDTPLPPNETPTFLKPVIEVQKRFWRLDSP